MDILVGVDLSDSTAEVVDKAEDVAKALSAKVWLLHVGDPDPDFVGYDAGPQSVRDSVAQKYHEEHRQIQAIAERFRQMGLKATALLVQGATAETILKEAAKLKVGMVVMGSHGRGMMRHLLVGSVSEDVIRRSLVPVLVVPTHNRD
jgi:nucleotide-binding universal stress UspA family protein